MINYKKLIEEAKKDNVVKIVVGAIIVKENKVLLLHRPKDDFMSNIFELPSGNLELNETIEQGLKRETLEETGLKIKSINSYIGYFDYLSKSGKKTRQFNFFVATDRTGPVVLTEHDSYAWADPSDIGRYNVTDKVKKIIDKHFNISSGIN